MNIHLTPGILESVIWVKVPIQMDFTITPNFSIGDVTDKLEFVSNASRFTRSKELRKALKQSASSDFFFLFFSTSREGDLRLSVLPIHRIYDYDRFIAGFVSELPDDNLIGIFRKKCYTVEKLLNLAASTIITSVRPSWRRMAKVKTLISEHIGNCALSKIKHFSGDEPFIVDCSFLSSVQSGEYLHLVTRYEEIDFRINDGFPVLFFATSPKDFMYDEGIYVFHKFIKEGFL